MKKRRVVIFGATHFGVGIIVFALTSAVATANLAGTGQFVRDFFTSAGFGGLAALAAAAIAYSGIRHQASVARSALENNERAEEAKRWWSTFQWTADRALPSAPDAVALPLVVAIATLQELASTATDHAQEIACGGLVSELAEKAAQKDEPPEPVGEQISSTKRRVPHGPGLDEKVSAALESYMQATEGSAAESSILRRRAYEESVRTALARIATQLGLEYESTALLGLFGNPDLEHRYEPDGAIITAGRIQALIEVVAFERAGSQIIARLQHIAGNPAYPVLFIAPMPMPEFMEGDGRRGVRWVQWSPGDSERILRDALSDLASLSDP